MESLNVMLIGMTVVFLVLIGLTFAIYIFSKLFDINIGTNEANKIIRNVAAPVNPPASLSHHNEDYELIAAITAAIQSFYGRKLESRLVVKSVRRIPINTSGWHMASRFKDLN